MLQQVGAPMPICWVATQTDLPLSEPHQGLAPLLSATTGDGPGTYSVRSSFPDETAVFSEARDGDPVTKGAALGREVFQAPGVYTSELDVPLTDVPQAIERVLASGESPGARAYRARAGYATNAAPQVLIHRFSPQKQAAGPGAQARRGPSAPRWPHPCRRFCGSGGAGTSGT